MANEKLICEECEATGEDVLKTNTYWTAGGRNVFDFNWYKDKNGMILCQE